MQWTRIDFTDVLGVLFCSIMEYCLHSKKPDDSY